MATGPDIPEWLMLWYCLIRPQGVSFSKRQCPTRVLSPQSLSQKSTMGLEQKLGTLRERNDRSGSAPG